jgi:CheY-like chemotaxis protein
LPNPLREILLVDDNENDVELTTLEFHGLKLANGIVAARDGVEALDYLKCRGRFAERASHPPLFILLDLKMPRMDGLEVLRQVRADPELALIPIIVMTSSREHPDLTAAYRLGANAYVVKPVNFDEFREAVASLGMFWAILNESAPPHG